MGTALVTGASVGLGLHFSEMFARDGHSLILVARRKDLLDQIAVDLKKQNPAIRIDVIAMDLAVPEAGKDLFQKVSGLGVPVDFLVNNAGFGSNGDFSKLPLNRELQMIDLNMRTLVELTGLFLPQMIARKSGKILNVGSTAGLQPGPFMATYFATKAFVNSFSQSLSDVLHGTGVTCTLLIPGATATDFAKNADLEKSRLFTMNKPASAKIVAACGYKAMMDGRSKVIQGFMNNVLALLTKLSPTSLSMKVTRFLTQR